MSYPTSSDVLSGTPILASQMNALRADAIRLGQTAADAVLLATAMRRWSQYVDFVAEGTTKVRVPFDDRKPPTLMISGCLLQAVANVDSPALSGSAGSYYLMAKRTAGSSTFTLVWSSTGLEGTDERYVCGVDWSGTAITRIVPFADINSGGAMKITAGVGYEALPNDFTGNSVTPGSGAYGSWDEMRAASGSAEVLICAVGLGGNAGVNLTSVMVEIGTGASGSETGVSVVRCEALPISGGFVITLPAPIKVAAGTRIAVRAGANLNYAILVSLLVIQTSNLQDL